MPEIKIGDTIILTWEGSDQTETCEIVSVQGGGVEPKGHGFIRDDLPKWDEAKASWTYCYGRTSGS